MTILLNPGGTFSGPFTHDPQPGAGQTRVEISEDAYARLQSLGPGVVLYADGTFRLAANAAEAIAALPPAEALALMKQQMPATMRAALYREGMQAAYDAQDFEALAVILTEYEPRNAEEEQLKALALSLFT